MLTRNQKSLISQLKAWQLTLNHLEIRRKPEQLFYQDSLSPDEIVDKFEEGLNDRLQKVIRKARIGNTAEGEYLCGMFEGMTFVYEIDKMKKLP
ncbi:MAG: hypothetical protein Q7S26_01380 [bacterium]|nr:hypothetical protein [bacterium]